MRIRIVLIALLGMLFSVAGHAQKVSSENGMYTIRSAGHLKPGKYSSKKKPTTTTATNDYTCTQADAPNDLSSAESNELVYGYFEVANEEVGLKDWMEAYKYCKELNVNGRTGWRLPVYRELMLMYVLRFELEALAGFKPFTVAQRVGYWSATDGDKPNEKGEKEKSGYCWNISFSAPLGAVGTSQKFRTPTAPAISVTPNYIRCIRDLDIP